MSNGKRSWTSGLADEQEVAGLVAREPDRRIFGHLAYPHALDHRQDLQLQPPEQLLGWQHDAVLTQKIEKRLRKVECGPPVVSTTGSTPPDVSSRRARLRAIVRRACARASSVMPRSSRGTADRVIAPE